MAEAMEPAILYFHSKGLAKSLEQDFVLHAAEESGLLPPSAVTGQLEAAVVFVDLASFTSLTESMGDLTATEVLSRFSQLVRRAVSQPHNAAPEDQRQGDYPKVPKSGLYLVAEDQAGDADGQ